MRWTTCTAAAAAVALMTASAAAQEVVRFATVFEAPQVERWMPLIEAYEAANPGVDIQLETTAGSGAAVYPDVLRTSMVSGDPPDLFFMWGGSLSTPFIAAGQVRNLDADYEAYGWGDKFPEWIKERLSYEGSIYGVPYRSRGMGLWYRKDMFEQYGLKPPTTYAELEGICTTLAENGKYCASFGGKFGWHTMRLLDYFVEEICGAEVHDELNALRQSWNQDCVVQAFDRMRKWVDNRWLVPDFLTVSPFDSRFPMYAGDAAMVYEGVSFEGTLVADEQDGEGYDFFLPPTAEGRYHAYPEQWMISANAKNPEGALKFIDWITSVEQGNAFPDALSGSATIGVVPDCSVSPRACKWADILGSSAGTYPPTDQAFPKELIDSFFEAQDAVVAGRMSGADAAALMQRRIEEYTGA